MSCTSIPVLQPERVVDWFSQLTNAKHSCLTRASPARHYILQHLLGAGCTSSQVVSLCISGFKRGVSPQQKSKAHCCPLNSWDRNEKKKRFISVSTCHPLARLFRLLLQVACQRVGAITWHPVRPKSVALHLDDNLGFVTYVLYTYWWYYTFVHPSMQHEWVKKIRQPCKIEM